MGADIENWMLAFVRAGAFLAVLPVFSSANVPVMLRMALAAMLGALVAPNLPELPAPPGFAAAVGQLVVEVLVGLALGFTARIAFGAFEIAGQLITSELGLSMNAVMNPISSAPTQAPGMILFLLATVLLFGLDLHHWLLAGFAKSYEVVPVGGIHLNEGLLQMMVRQTSSMFAVALEMTAPIMAVTFIITLVFSILGRAVPQMDVFSSSFAIRIAGGLAVFGMVLPLIGQHMSNMLRRIPDDLMRVAHWLGTP